MTQYMQGNIRIPNIPSGKVVDENGFASDDEQTFRRVLITSLQNNFGPEGCVVPSQTTAKILTIQNNTYVEPATGNTIYTCQGGTLIYDTDTNQLKVAKLVAGVPTFVVIV